MSVGMLEKTTVGKKRAGRPKAESVRGIGKPVRLDPDLYAKADVVARRRGVKLGPWLSEVLEPVVNREYASVLKELAALEGSK